MASNHLTLKFIPEALAILKLPAAGLLPPWVWQGDFVSVTRTPEELSVVCPQAMVPEEIEAVGGWQALRVEGVLDFSLVGILAALTATLAEAGISIFAVSTYNTDYILVRVNEMERAIAALTAQGHHIIR